MPFIEPDHDCYKEAEEDVFTIRWELNEDGAPDLMRKVWACPVCFRSWRIFGFSWNGNAITGWSWAQL